MSNLYHTRRNLVKYPSILEPIKHARSTSLAQELCFDNGNITVSLFIWSFIRKTILDARPKSDVFRIDEICEFTANSVNL